MSRLIPSLPDEISILCIARVPPSNYNLLSAVSRSWRELLRSSLLLSARKEVGTSQPFLFISIRQPSPTDQCHWYLLDRSHTRNDSSALISLPVQPHPSALFCASVSLGPSLYLFGGFINKQASPIVQIYDARFNYWRRGPDMSVSRGRAHASVISGRIYVVGGCFDFNEYWAEEFDPENDQWRPVPSPPLAIQDIQRDGNTYGIAVIGGKLFVMMSFWCVVFDPAVLEIELVMQAERAWSLAPSFLAFHLVAAVEEVLYRNDTNSMNIKWYDFTKDEWRPVEGVNKALPKFSRRVRLINLGQELCLVSGERWEGEKMEIIFAGVRLTKIDTGELQGSAEWEETCALPCPRETSIVDCISLEF